ncbi:MAG: RluA family pseudouridine synthase [Lachnospiraceae bacterium]|nr:RluA family pseudouridine synthase [Lachnospiraceae bacterium]
MQEILIEQNQAGQRLDKFLHKYLPQAGSSFLYKMLRKKNITLNGKKAEGKEILQLHDKVQCFFSEETFLKFSGRTSVTFRDCTDDAVIDISEYTSAYKKVPVSSSDILYEDEHVLVINKPVGVLTQKAKATDSSLNEWLIGYLLNKKKITAKELTLFKPSVCNRLDRNTSGIVLCGISLQGSQELSRLIRDREVKKYYRTIIKGTLKQGAVLEGSLTKNHSKNMVTVSIEGSEIKTAYEPIQALLYNMTYLEVELITGKPHQIRAHLASIGHPLIGDTKYGNKAVNQKVEKSYGLKNQLLHAYRMEFPQLDGALKGLSAQVLLAPLPQKFVRILEDLS